MPETQTIAILAKGVKSYTCRIKILGFPMSVGQLLPSKYLHGAVMYELHCMQAFLTLLLSQLVSNPHQLNTTFH